ncbi:MAG: ATP phosphoribosyltransferase regulatory subunit [Clostridia bacterium]|nr:ATP phosphoribosyltransferase regulatory subunit [Clostridia bacterium]
MKLKSEYMRTEEKVIFALRELYSKYGYAQFKMSKFEEYDLYVKNKDFLVSDSVITFNDTNGKLLALKPDVTLSIIKNSTDSSGVQKLYYNENVYRVSKNTHSFKEIMQTGLECIGNIGTYNICEVVTLAAKSLSAISDKFVLDISHMGLISSVLAEINDDVKTQILKFISEKNTHDLISLCDNEGVDSKTIVSLINVNGTVDEIKEKLLAIPFPESAADALEEIFTIANILENTQDKDKIHFDFSIVNDMNYYSGIVFKGYIEGIPTGILSGGRYDLLMNKMGKKSGAIGFAVYLDFLERFMEETKEYDTDILLLYNDTDKLAEVLKTVDTLTTQGNRVLAEKTVPEGLKYKTLLRFE